jgi:hypothetical protein
VAVDRCEEVSDKANVYILVDQIRNERRDPSLTMDKSEPTALVDTAQKTTFLTIFFKGHQPLALDP